MKQPWQQLPDKFLEKIEQILPEEERIEIYKAFCSRKPTTFRVNTIKSSEKEVVSQLLIGGFDLEAVKGIGGAYILKNRSQAELQDTGAYKIGFIYIQSLSSMLPPLVLAPQPGDRVLDITAAPGSKTTQMAAMMGNEGEILANDNSRIRLYRMEANLKLLGVTNTKIKISHGQTIWREYPEYFDRALVDVPCSMEGRFFCEDPKSYKDWSPGKVKELQERQKYILRSAISATKVGGEIVYSTCTLSPEENEGVIEWIIKKHGESVMIEEIKLPGLKVNPGIRNWKGKDFDKSINKTVRIYPNEIMEGFFIAKLKKIKTSLNVLP